MSKKYVNSVVSLIIMFGFGYFLPTIDPITPLGMKILGVFLGCIYAWLSVDIFWPSIFGLVALGLTGYMPIPQVFASAFSNTNVILVFFMMILGGMIISSGVADILARKINFAKNSPRPAMGDSNIFNEHIFYYFRFARRCSWSGYYLLEFII